MLRHLFVIAGLLLAAPALAEDLEGVVAISGSAINAKVTLGTASGSPVICRDETGKRIGRLTGMTVKVTGEWALNKDGGKRCVTATSFSVVKMSSGRPAVVGLLSQKDGSYVVAGDDGAVHTLADVPTGLKKLDGQKVIIDVKPMETPAAGPSAFKVVSYAPFP